MLKRLLCKLIGHKYVCFKTIGTDGHSHGNYRKYYAHYYVCSRCNKEYNYNVLNSEYLLNAGINYMKDTKVIKLINDKFKIKLFKHSAVIAPNIYALFLEVLHEVLDDIEKERLNR